MKILGIDTTTKIASVSIKNENEIFTLSIDNEITHSEKLLPLIDNSLKKANITLKDIDLYACINGPGSFTGIRIGLSTLKAFAQVYKKDIFSISSLELLAYSAFCKQKEKQIYCINMIDAKNDRVYYDITKITKINNDKIEIKEILDTSNDLIDDAISNILTFISNNDISKDLLYICGNCTDTFSLKLNNICSNMFNLYPTTQDLINLYTNLNNVDDYIFNAFTLDANYKRKSQAERIKNE